MIIFLFYYLFFTKKLGIKKKNIISSKIKIKINNSFLIKKIIMGMK